jgi:mannose-6-phosphate isomerase-like protein (cupin superfamily)
MPHHSAELHSLQWFTSIHALGENGRGGQMEYLRKVDIGHFESLDEGRIELAGHKSGGTTCQIQYIKHRAGGGAPLKAPHTHAFDQMFYILSGIMAMEIEGKRYDAEAGTLVVLPAGVAHWTFNDGKVPTLFLAIHSPLPDPAVPIATMVDARGA